MVMASAMLAIQIRMMAQRATWTAMAWPTTQITVPTSRTAIRQTSTPMVSVIAAIQTMTTTVSWMRTTFVQILRQAHRLTPPAVLMPTATASLTQMTIVKHIANADQADFDHDGLGDACDPDDDNDGVADANDLCPNTPAGTQVNAAGCPDADGDGVADANDNCPGTANARTRRTLITMGSVMHAILTTTTTAWQMLTTSARTLRSARK